MAARQKATRHKLEDGIVVAWDSSEVDESLRKQLIELADRPLGDIIVGMGGDTEAIVEVKAPAARSTRKAARSRRRSQAA